MTRWRLKRDPLHGVVLVVELVEPPPARGYQHFVRDRAHARACLKALRPMVEAIATERATPALFDPAEVDDAA